MALRRRRALVLASLTLFVASARAPTAPLRPAAAARAPQGLPPRLSDREFWRLITQFSESGGYFRSDNFVSNELTFQEVIPKLLERVSPGGVYLGVGPDQNFTYLVALRPGLAFIFDIRRQNMLQHLFYKALIEMSADRAEFLSHLFARPRPDGLDTAASAAALLQAYHAVAPDSALFRDALARVKDRLLRDHGFTLTGDDLAKIEYVSGAFFTGGPDLSYTFSPGGTGPYGWRSMPTYTELMTTTDGKGTQRSYLASEDNFRLLVALERNNLVVPLVGDFAGDKAIRAVGRYLQDHGVTVTAFYTSNVEQYLFRQADDWKKFYANVATLPIDGASTFIRAVFNRGGWGYQTPSPGPRSVTVLSPIAELLTAVSGGEIQGYDDVIQLSR